jgi:cysteinyl-tRNA synthetase
LLGPQIDIHCGGEDNIFPHHEAEIAQTECVTGLTFVRLWMHCRHLMVEGRKMAKSEGNFFTLRNLVEKGWSGREVRYALISVRYREPLNFTFEGLASARSALLRLDEWSRRLDAAAAGYTGNSESLPDDFDLAGFGNALDDDLNISAALAALFDIVRESNRLLDTASLTAGQAFALARWRDGVQTVLALDPGTAEVPAQVAALVEARAAARASKDWAASDRMRDQIASQGWIIKDTKEGQKLTPR